MWLKLVVIVCVPGVAQTVTLSLTSRRVNDTVKLDDVWMIGEHLEQIDFSQSDLRELRAICLSQTYTDIH